MKAKFRRTTWKMEHNRMFLPTSSTFALPRRNLPSYLANSNIKSKAVPLKQVPLMFQPHFSAPPARHPNHIATTNNKLQNSLVSRRISSRIFLIFSTIAAAAVSLLCGIIRKSSQQKSFFPLCLFNEVGMKVCCFKLRKRIRECFALFSWDIKLIGYSSYVFNSLFV